MHYGISENQDFPWEEPSYESGPTLSTHATLIDAVRAAEAHAQSLRASHRSDCYSVNVTLWSDARAHGGMAIASIYVWGDVEPESEWWAARVASTG